MLERSEFSLHVLDQNGGVNVTTVSPRSKTLLYFYNPACLDCLAASPVVGEMKLTAPLVVVPTDHTETAYDYLKKAGIKNAVVSLDYNVLSEKFKIMRVPALYVFKGGQLQGVIFDFHPAALEAALRSYGVVS